MRKMKHKAKIFFLINKATDETLSQIDFEATLIFTNIQYKLLKEDK